MTSRIESVCDDLAAFADQELSPERAEAFRGHLASCDKCREELVEAAQWSARLEALAPAPVDRKQPQAEPPPIPMILWCPECRARHLDPPTMPPHKVHACKACGFNWRQANVPTVGVQFLPGCVDPLSDIDLDMAAEGFYRIGRIDSVGRRSLWLREDEDSFTLRAGREGRDVQVKVTKDHPLYRELDDALSSARFAAEFEHPHGAALAGYPGVRPLDIEDCLLPESSDAQPAVALHDECLTPLDDEATCSKCMVSVPSDRIVRRPLRWRLAEGDVIMLLGERVIMLVITAVRNTGYTWEYVDRARGTRVDEDYITENSSDPWLELEPWVLVLRGACRPL